MYALWKASEFLPEGEGHPRPPDSRPQDLRVGEEQPRGSDAASLD